MKIIDYIPVGHKNAVTRKQLVILTGLSDRKIRNMIQEECNREHPILNMQDGKVSEIDKYLKCQNNELERNQISISDVIGGGK